MSLQKQLSTFVDTILMNYIQEDNSIDQAQNTIIEDYKKLNEKCDDVILKIKVRKNKKKIAKK